MSVDNSTLDQLKACQISQMEHLPKGSYLYRQGETAYSFYYIKSGLIGLYHMVDNGKESLIRLYDNDQFFGYRTWFSPGQTYHCSAKVLLPATLVKITPDSQGFLVSNPDLTLRLLTDISDELANAESRLAHISYDKSLKRVYDALNFLYNTYPEYPWSYREVAEFAGCETETAIRIARELKKEGKLPHNRE